MSTACSEPKSFEDISNRQEDGGSIVNTNNDVNFIVS